MTVKSSPFLAICLLLLITCVPGCTSQPEADTIFYNGKIVTLNTNDDIVEALAIR